MIYDMIWYDIWYDMIWYDMIWYDMIWYDDMMIWYDIIYIFIIKEVNAHTIPHVCGVALYIFGSVVPDVSRIVIPWCSRDIQPNRDSLGLFDTEYQGTPVFRNVWNCLPTTQLYIPEDLNFQHHCENLRSNALTLDTCLEQFGSAH